MAVKWIEGFETHTNTTTLDQKWLSATGMSTAAGRVLGSSATGSIVMTTPSLGLDNTMIFGIGIRVNSNAVFTGERGFYFQRGAQEQCHLYIDFQSGVGYDLQLKTGTGTIVDQTATTLDFDIWYYIELKCECVASGAYELRVNGVTQFSGTGAVLNDSGLTGADTFGLNFPATFLSTRFFLDDLYVLDGSGATANDFIGAQTIEGIEVTANGAVNAWTQDGAGDNYTSVDDGPTSHTDSGVGGTVSSGTLAQEDLYAMSDLASLTGSISAVQFNARAAVDVAGTRTMLFKVKTGVNASASAGSSPVSDTVFKNIHQVMETNPSTAAGWSIADVNDTQLGVETGA